MTTIKTPKKLIEVALPLDAINTASAREKTIRHGHPSNLHRWWARRPLAAARAVIFAQMVNDPGYQQGGGFKYGVNKEKAEIERERLFKIIEDLVLWENTNNQDVLVQARNEIWRSWRETCELNKNHPQASELFNPEKLPAFHDPFAGGGALPLEAQRLGLESFATDLNPVAVSINKAMIEIPSKFAGLAPVGPRVPGDKQRKLTEDWSGVKGLAEDVYRYGTWMRNEAEKRIGHLYPKIEITAELGSERPELKPLIGKQLPVIAWLWARTVKSPNPAFSHVEVPLASSFVLSNKAGKEAYVEPVVNGDKYDFVVRTGSLTDAAKLGTKPAGRGANFECVLSRTPIGGDYIKSEGKAGRIGARLMAIVAEGPRGRVYISPTAFHEDTARKVDATWRPSGDVPARLTGGTCVPYGLKEWGDLFTPRQLVALTTLSDLIHETIAYCQKDALKAGFSSDETSLDNGGLGAKAYGEAIGLYLGIALSKSIDSNNNLCPWEPTAQCVRQLFNRQSIPMLWDFGEANPLLDSSGGFSTNIDVGVRAFDTFAKVPVPGFASQLARIFHRRGRRNSRKARYYWCSRQF